MSTSMQSAPSTHNRQPSTDERKVWRVVVAGLTAAGLALGASGCKPFTTPKPGESTHIKAGTEFYNSPPFGEHKDLKSCGVAAQDFNATKTHETVNVGLNSTINYEGVSVNEVPFTVDGACQSEDDGTVWFVGAITIVQAPGVEPGRN